MKAFDKEKGKFWGDLRAQQLTRQDVRKRNVRSLL
jgi:hypothetical protein